MILVTYRHGLRASEVCLEWHRSSSTKPDCMYVGPSVARQAFILRAQLWVMASAHCFTVIRITGCYR